jgi:CRISPR-associated endonuclease/helicase Cas3
MPEDADFAGFYRAVHAGRAPFPWQSRLAALVDESGWPAEIGVGTGLGKTSCLDIAVWALARQAHRSPIERTAATRIWYVVNRRLLVDAAFDHGCHLAALLGDPDRARQHGLDPQDISVIEKVAAALGSLRGGAGHEPLHVTRLRGGAELGARPPDPSQPSLIFATVAMFASRWLFRGYGTSASMRPVDAALAGIDSLILLDEAHLARPLQLLGGPLAECDVGDPARVLPAARGRPVLVNLTATGDSPEAFRLDGADEAHPVVRARLHASKPARLVTTQSKALVDTLVTQAGELLARRRPSSAVIFVNSPGTARSVFDQLAVEARRRELDLDAELLTGRIRDREAEQVRARILDPVIGAPAGRARTSRDRHLVVVATQTLEVGADLDFEVLVTEACGARALVQRLGRLNRLGEIERAEAVIVFASDAKTFGIYGDEPRAVCDRLDQQTRNGAVDLGPRHITKAVGPPGDMPNRVGELLPAHVWEWAKTTNPPVGEAPPELFFAGFDEQLAIVSIAWRVAIPADGAELRPPVSAAEAVDLPIWEAKEALADLTDGTVNRLKPDRVSVERSVPVDRLRPGDQVILPASAGRYDSYGWAPQARQPVLDLSLLRPPGIPLIPQAVRSLLAPGEDLDAALAAATQLAEPPEPDEEIDRAATAAELRDQFIAAGPNITLRPQEWEHLVAGLHSEVEYPADGTAWLLHRPLRPAALDVELRSDVFDELSFTATSATLTQHLGSVGELAGRIAAKVGVSPDLVDAVTAAGRFHDLGKADVRFQRWLDPTGTNPGPVAKSSRPWYRWQSDRSASGWPQGGRHEELSRRLVKDWLANRSVGWDPDLVLHLVVSHHGNGRPLVDGVDDQAPTVVSFEIEGHQISVSADLAQVDWEQPGRFRRCCEGYGYWGLALLEGVVRQADHQISAVVVA